ncbi:hypothetical protein [Clostridium sp. DL1XJH146]
MNTQGWIRGLIAHNRPLDDFIKYVLTTIGKEFDINVNYKRKDNENIVFCIDKVQFEISLDKLQYLQSKGPYALDRYILDYLKERGFEFDINRSQYIRYCYGLIVSTN